MLTAASPVEARPTNSSIRFGRLPADSTTVGRPTSSTKERLRGLVPGLRHELQLCGCLRQRHRDDVVAVERCHPPPLPLLHEIGGLEAEAQPEDAVARGRAAAALDVAEHR